MSRLSDLRKALETERAAREQAEKDARHYAERAEAWELGCSEAKSYWQQAEADCATQKALLAATEQQLEIKAALLESERAAREQAEKGEQYHANRAHNAERELASALALAKEHHANWKHAQQLVLEVAGERDTALARVEGLELTIREGTHQLNQQARHIENLVRLLDESKAETAAALLQVTHVEAQRDEWCRQCNMASEAQADALNALSRGSSGEVVAHAETLGKLQAAETALASARPLIEGLAIGYGDNAEGAELVEGAIAWLTSHPAPVAAQSLEQGLIGALLRLLDRYEGCPAEDYADAWWTARSLLRGHREQLALAGTAPVAAPCADTRCPVFGCGISASDGLPCPFDGHARPDDCKVKP